MKDLLQKKGVNMTRVGVDANVEDKLKERLCSKQFAHRYTEYYGELLDVADLEYGLISPGHEAAKELYWLKTAADSGDDRRNMGGIYNDI